jgi:hypothetical protein
LSEKRYLVLWLTSRRGPTFYDEFVTLKGAQNAMNRLRRNPSVFRAQMFDADENEAIDQFKAGQA